MTHSFSSLVDLPLKIGQPSHLLLLPLHLLMDDFHVPDILVQLLLLECWTGGLSLLASSLSERERESLLICVQWLQYSSPWRCYLLRRHDEGQCFIEGCGSEYTGGGRQCWGLVLKCYELRTRQHKMLKVNARCPSKALFPLGYNDLQTKVMKDVPSSSRYMLIEEEAYGI
jgi:hypothetical protein